MLGSTRASASFTVRKIFRNPKRCCSLSAAAAIPAEPPRRRRIVFSGIQPTGVPHIGNHLGALCQWQSLVKEVSLQPANARDSLFFCVVGLHALTVPQDPDQLRQQRRDMFAVLLALGLDDRLGNAVIFHQDQVREHAELAWYLNCVTPVNRLQRMTSWKSKLAQNRNANSEEEVDESLLQLGLFAYPVLQAADILLYQTTHVPVGHDQTQHLELARDLAQSFNRTYPGKGKGGKGKGKGVFRVPEVMLTEHPRIQSLRSPLQKMSKSSPTEASKILLTDSPSEIRSRFKSAVTDSIPGVSWDPINRPGVANLLQIHSGYSGESVEALAGKFTGPKAMQDLKESCAEVVQSSLKSFRDEFERIRKEEGYLKERELEGARRARDAAHKVMVEVRAVVGTD